MLNEKEQKILDLIKMGGPILPVKVSKSLGIETYLAGAILSVLVKNGHIRISHKKVGSSPLYYAPGQEETVRGILSKELNDLERRTLDRLKELRVAFENDLYPQERFLLKGLSDFVMPMRLKQGEEEINLWKHSSVSDEELDNIIQKKLESLKPKQETVEEEKIELPEPPEQEELTVQPEKKETKIKRSRAPRKPRQPSEFENRAKQYLKDSGAEILDETRVKRGETLFNIGLPTGIGIQGFLVKMKDKKTINESELSQFYLECMNSKKPGILLIPRDLSKKLQRFMDKNIGKLIRIVVIK